MNSAAVQMVLRKAVQDGVVPQAVAVTADRDGRCHEAAAGPRTVDGTEPVSAGALFRIASMTKVVATVAALRQVERGELDLAAPVRDYLPEFAELPVLQGFSGDTPQLRPPATQATVGQLVTHTSGLGYWFWNADLWRWHQITGTPTTTAGDRSVFGAPLIADPGTRFEYGISTDWLGEVVSAVAGRPLPGHLADTVFAPLGMRHTTFSPTDADRTGLVPVHLKRDGAWTATTIDYSRQPQWWSAGQGIYSTPRDFLRFLRMLLGGGALDGERILRAATVAAMFTNQIGALEFPAHIPTAHPKTACSWHGPAGQKWGHGLLLNTVAQPGMRAAGSGAWAGIFNSFYWVDPASGVTGALFGQTLPFITPEVVDLYATFERGVYRG